jgi:hypothetical protein
MRFKRHSMVTLVCVFGASMAVAGCAAAGPDSEEEKGEELGDRDEAVAISEEIELEDSVLLGGGQGPVQDCSDAQKSLATSKCQQHGLGKSSACWRSDGDTITFKCDKGGDQLYQTQDNTT